MKPIVIFNPNMILNKPFITIIFIFLSATAFCQKGKYKENNSDHASPLTIFSKKQGLITDQLQDLRSLILNNDTLKKAYINIYKNARDIALSIPVDKTQENPNTRIAKYAAFVYLIGFKCINNEDILPEDSLRRHLDKVLSFFEEREGSDGKYFKCDKQWFRGDWIFDDDKDAINLGRAKELTRMLQAYDLIKTAHAIGLWTDPDAAERLENIRGRKTTVRKKKKYPNLQRFVRNHYQKNRELGGPLGWRDNQTLIVASGLGMASVVLNDASVKRSYRTTWRPDKWIESANWHINKTMWTADKHPLSRKGEMSGYTEGPDYFQYAFSSMLPYFLAFDNFVPDYHKREYDRPGFLVFFTGKEDVMNFFDDLSYDNVYQWYADIVQPDGTLPTYDDTHIGAQFHEIAISRKPQFCVYRGTLSTPDFLAARMPAKKPGAKMNLLNFQSGNIIFRSSNENELSEQHYFHALIEPEKARDRNRLRGLKYHTHEHPDMGSFMISAGGDQLIIDPYYTTYTTRDKIAREMHQNVIGVAIDDDFYSHPLDGGNAKNIIAYTQPGYRFLQFDYSFSAFNESTGWGYTEHFIRRRMERFDTPDSTAPYYVITDYAHNSNTNTRYQININGYGDFAIDSSGINGTKAFRWRRSNAKKWGVQVESTVYNGTNISHNGISTENNITRLQVEARGKDVVFHTIYRPKALHQRMPVALPRITSNHTSHLMDSIGNEFRKVFHFAKLRDTVEITISNPFELEDTSNYIISDAHNGFLALAPQNYSVRYCISETYFRKAGITTGKKLTYTDVSGLQSYITTAKPAGIEWENTCFNKRVTSHYELLSKFKYRGFTYLEDGATCANVTYLLPDLEPGYQVVARKERTGELLTSYYNAATRQITIQFSEPKTAFYIELQDPCMLGCFFPPTAQTIDTVFLFNEGTREVLTDDLDIVQPDGFLKITNGSVMSICSDQTLVNQHQLMLEGAPDELEELFDTEENFIGYDTLSNLSKIIVNDRAALVLDENSETTIGINALIHVKTGGTLMVRSGAIVHLGSPGAPGHAQIIVEEGAYVCIEEGADIRFIKTAVDTVDNNYFFIKLNPAPQTAYAGLNTDVGSGIFLPMGRFNSRFCLDICDIKDVIAPDGINDKDFGWTNFTHPLARIRMAPNYCTGSPIIADFSKTLNETAWWLKHYYFDVNAQKLVLSDSISNITPRSNRADTIHCASHVGVNTLILYVTNDCGELDSAIHTFTVDSNLVLDFTLIRNLDYCEGISAITADGSASSAVIAHTWHVERLFPGDTLESDWDEEITNSDDFSESYEVSGPVSNSFSFPGYFFKGGYEYQISLTAVNACGIEFTRTDTIGFPYGVEISFINDDLNELELNPDTLYIHGADNWNGRIFHANLMGPLPPGEEVRWYLDGVELTSLPDQYILSMTDLRDASESGIEPGCHTLVLGADFGNCMIFDTVVFCYNQNNHLGFAEGSKYICQGDEVVIINTGTSGCDYLWLWNNGQNSLANDPELHVSPDTTTTYYLLLTCGSAIEVESITIYVSQPVEPVFVAETQSPYYLCFENESEPAQSGVVFTWNFDDGSPLAYGSNICHQFPTDTNGVYEVCMTATNICGSYDTCITLYFEGTGGYLRIAQQGIDNEEPGSSNQTHNKSKIIGCYPNPFNGSTFMTYEFSEGVETAWIDIYDSYGKKVKTIHVNPAVPNSVIQMSEYAAGLYNCILTTNLGVAGSHKIILSER